MELGKAMYEAQSKAEAGPEANADGSVDAEYADADAAKTGSKDDKEGDAA
jgi:hypothetical protein